VTKGKATGSGRRATAVRASAATHAQYVLRVRMYAARIAWLEGDIRWDAAQKRVVWQLPDKQRFAPEAANLARAEYYLNRIALHPLSATAAFGDSEVWLQKQRAHLELAKRLLTPSPDALSLLRAEAVCLDAITPSSAAEMVKRARASAAYRTETRAALGQLLEDDTLTLPVQRLIALTLGALDRVEGQDASIPVRGDNTVYWRGRNAGLPAAPGLWIALYSAAHEEKIEIADRCEVVRVALEKEALGACCAAPDYVRLLLAQGVAPSAIVSLLEGMLETLPPLSARLRSRRQELPRLPERESPEEAADWQAQRRSVIQELSKILAEYVASAQGNPEAVTCFIHFCRRMLAITRLTPHLPDVVVRPLRAGLKLLPLHRFAWLQLLGNHSALIWDDKCPKPMALLEKQVGWVGQREKAAGDVYRWVERRWVQQGKPALEFLQRHEGNLDFLLQVLEIHWLVTYILSAEWLTPAAYRWIRESLFLLSASEVTDEKPDSEPFWWSLSLFIGNAAAPSSLSLPKLQRLLTPLIRAVISIPSPSLRVHLMDALVGECGLDWEENSRLVGVTRENIAFFRRLLEEGKHAENSLSELIFVGSELKRLVGEGDIALSLELLAPLGEPCNEVSARIRKAALLLRLLVSPAITEAREIFDAVRAHPALLDTIRSDELEEGLSLLEKFTALQEAVRAGFLRQPQRCFNLLRQFAQVKRFGKEDVIRAPLTLLDTSTINEERCETDDAEWQAVLSLTPEIAPLVMRYWYAQWLLGRSAAVPPGLRRATLAVPDRLEGELAYLLEKQKNAEGDERTAAGIAARIGSLQSRLADSERLRQQAATEAQERLETVTQEALLAAAEQQVAACYQARLELLLGPLSATCIFDDNLNNAISMASNIHHNRKLLLRLLRAHAEEPGGARALVEGHPGNSAYRVALAAKGVDVPFWLGEHRRRVTLPGGRRVLLFLEQDPLHVLQMGSYFGTCLSADSFNAFSAVTNAYEQNKRVLYIRDEATGKIVGRKLIGITETNELLGFRLYCTLNSSENEELSKVAQQYLATFAQRCRLPLVDSGTVPTLFAQSWYDDGAVAWADTVSEAQGGEGDEGDAPAGEEIPAGTPLTARPTHSYNKLCLSC
jgi:hypothetical protein